MSRPVTITTRLKTQILSMYSAGFTGRAVAVALVCKPHVVFRVLKEHGAAREPIAPSTTGRRVDPQIISSRWAAFKIGDRFGRLTITGERIRRKGQSYFPCACECGKRVFTRAASLKRNGVRSCGCLKRDVASELQAKLKTKHGHARRTYRLKSTAEYRAWRAMKTRCLNPKSTRFDQWGGRGITICPQWLGPNGFTQFLADVGPKPSPSHSIDRIDNDGNYEPGNVRWATPTEQARNKRRK